jgi:hypothetical protein
VIAYPHYLPEPPTQLYDKIMLNVTPMPSGCLVWTRYRDSKGYGQVWWDGSMRWVHRMMYALMYGPIPEGMVVDHKCHNPSCVLPQHLRLMTHEENSMQRHRR